MLRTIFSILLCLNAFRYADSPKTCGKLCSLSNLQLRFLCPADIEEVYTYLLSWCIFSDKLKLKDFFPHISQVQALCSDWFPIVYPYYWYEEITSNPRFYSLAAVYEGVIIGLIVAEIKAFSELNDEV